jgi:hypothetical protein
MSQFIFSVRALQNFTEAESSIFWKVEKDILGLASQQSSEHLKVAQACA